MTVTWTLEGLPVVRIKYPGINVTVRPKACVRAFGGRYELRECFNTEIQMLAYVAFRPAVFHPMEFPLAEGGPQKGTK